MRKKERAAGYPRVSDPSKKDSPTLDSHEEAIRAHILQKGYDLLEEHMYPEAFTAFMLPFNERKVFMKLLEAAKRREFDVLVVTEFCRLARHQIEQAVIIDMLSKYGVRIESVTENFDDSAIGNYMRSTYAFIAEVEREKTVYRTTRGRRSRANEALTGQGRPTYGYFYADSDRYHKAKYVINDVVFYVDKDGTEWSEYGVVVFIFESILKGASLNQIAIYLTQQGIPTRGNKPYWAVGTVSAIANNEWYTGGGKNYRYTRHGREVTKREISEQIEVGEGLIPQIITVEMFQACQEQLARNKQFSKRNSKHPDVGALRAGMIVCSICGQRLHVRHHKPGIKYHQKPEYFCEQRTGREELVYKHSISYRVDTVDEKVWTVAKQYLRDPLCVRRMVDALIREHREKMQNSRDVKASLETIQKKISNLIFLAEGADDNELTNIKARVAELRNQKNKLEVMMGGVLIDEEEEQELEKALLRFEEWAHGQRKHLDDPAYVVDIEDMRKACLIIGIQVTVHPATVKERLQIEVYPPSVMSIVSRTLESH